MKMAESIGWISKYKREHPTSLREELKTAFAKASGAQLQRSVFAGDNYAIHFSEANTGSFPNVIISLSKLKKYDSNPMESFA